MHPRGSGVPGRSHFRPFTEVLRKIWPRVTRKMQKAGKPLQMRRDRGMIEALNHFVQKAGDEETLSNRNRDAARAKIKELVLFNLTARGAVGATDGSVLIWAE